MTQLFLFCYGHDAPPYYHEALSKLTSLKILKTSRCTISVYQDVPLSYLVLFYVMNSSVINAKWEKNK